MDQLENTNTDPSAPAFVVITKIYGVEDIDMVDTLAQLKSFIQETKQFLVEDEDYMLVCEIKDIVRGETPLLGEYQCPDCYVPLDYDVDEGVWICPSCSTYFTQLELDSIYVY